MNFIMPSNFFFFCSTHSLSNENILFHKKIGYYFVHSSCYMSALHIYVFCVLIVGIYRDIGGKFGMPGAPLDEIAAPGPRRTYE